MVRTYGLTHIAVAVRDVDRSARFYREVFGGIEVYHTADMVQLQTPGSRDVLVLEKASPEQLAIVGASGGIAHFGFRLQDAADVGRAAEEIARAGGKITSQGEFCPGEPYVFATDPDGYAIEVWYEIPTPVDPPEADVAVS